MENPRPEKVAVVDEVKSKLEASRSVILTEYRGLNVTEMAELRKSIRDAGAEYKVYKNRLVRFAARDLDLDLDELLTGPTAVAFAIPPDADTPADAVALAKALVDFAKANDKLVVKGGLLGDSAIDVDGIKKLARTPPRAQLYAEFLGAGLSFYQEFAGLLDSKLREFSYALEELADKGLLTEGETVVEAAEVADDTETTEAAAEVSDDTDTADATAEVSDDTDTADATDEAADDTETTDATDEAADDTETADATDEAADDTETADATDEAADDTETTEAAAEVADPSVDDSEDAGDDSDDPAEGGNDTEET